MGDTRGAIRSRRARPDGRNARSRRNEGGLRSARRPGVALALLCCACATSPLAEVAQGFFNAKQGYGFDAPADSAWAWERVSVPGSEVAYRGPSATWMTFSSRCGLTFTQPRYLARHLRFGLPEHTLREDAAVLAGAVPGWLQVFDTREAGRVVRVKTVTVSTEQCALDWVLSAPADGHYRAALPDFDAWWQSFRIQGPSEDSP